MSKIPKKKEIIFIFLCIFERKYLRQTSQRYEKVSKIPKKKETFYYFSSKRRIIIEIFRKNNKKNFVVTEKFMNFAPRFGNLPSYSFYNIIDLGFSYFYFPTVLREHRGGVFCENIQINIWWFRLKIVFLRPE